VNLHTLPTAILKEAYEIRQQIEKLEARISELLGGKVTPAKSDKKPATGRRKHRLSPEGRARIAAAARARWARERAASGAAAKAYSVKPRRTKRTLSPEARARIAAAAKARWAKRKAAEGTN